MIRRLYPSTIPSPLNDKCSPGWTIYKNNCYNFITSSGDVTWYECNSLCSSFDESIMLCITDDVTNTWIANQLNQLGYTYTWIGYFDHSDKHDNYQWVESCTSSYTNWASIETNSSDDDVFAVINYNGSWLTATSNNTNLCSCKYSLTSNGRNSNNTIIEHNYREGTIITIAVGMGLFALLLAIVLYHVGLLDGTIITSESHDTGNVIMSHGDDTLPHTDNAGHIVEAEANIYYDPIQIIYESEIFITTINEVDNQQNAITARIISID